MWRCLESARLWYLQQRGMDYIQMIPDVKPQARLPIIREKFLPAGLVCMDYYHSCNALDVYVFKCYRINHSKLFGRVKPKVN